jgi:hypothetical protein
MSQTCAELLIELQQKVARHRAMNLTDRLILTLDQRLTFLEKEVHDLQGAFLNTLIATLTELSEAKR